MFWGWKIECSRVSDVQAIELFTRLQKVFRVGDNVANSIFNVFDPFGYFNTRQSVDPAKQRLALRKNKASEKSLENFVAYVSRISQIQ